MTDRHYDLEALNAAMDASPGELDLPVDAGAIEGALPPELAGGAYLLNGPGLSQLDGWRMHPFDGHGYLRALRFTEAGGLRLQARFVRTPAYLEERGAGEVRYRGVGSLVPGGRWANMRSSSNKNVANTCVRPWGGRLLAGYEGGCPYALDPETLETLGPETLGGALEEGLPFLAHTRLDHARGELIGLSVLPGRRTTLRVVTAYEDGRPTQVREEVADGMVLLHDLAITERWVVIPENPVLPRPGPLLRYGLGGGSLIEAMACADRPGRVRLVPRGGGESVVISVDRPWFTLHHANAWDEGEGVRLVTTAFERFTFGGELGYRGPTLPLDPGARDPERSQRLLSVGLNPATGASEVHEITGWSVDFPRVHPHRDGLPTRWVWGATSTPEGLNDPFTALIRVDARSGETETWSAGPGRLVGEPLFVPHGDGEGEGWVLAMLHDVDGCSLGVFEALSLAQGPVATARMPVALPYGFHGGWL